VAAAWRPNGHVDPSGKIADAKSPYHSKHGSPMKEVDGQARPLTRAANPVLVPRNPTNTNGELGTGALGLRRRTYRSPDARVLYQVPEETCSL